MKITSKGSMLSSAAAAAAIAISLQLPVENTGVAFAQTCTTTPSGLVSWWPGDGNTNDIIGANPGVLYGATFATGKVGQAFSFDGVDDFVSLTDNVFPYPMAGPSNTPFSFGAWFKTTSGGVILGQQNADPFESPSGWVPAAYVGIDGRLRVQMFWKGIIDLIVSSGPVNDGIFHHVAITYDGTIQSVYLDGMLIGSKPFTQVAYASVYKYQIGTGFTSFWPGAPNGWYFFNGLIDEVEFYNRALMASEIQTIFAADSAGNCKQDADGDGVTDANDACPGTPPGTIVNIAGCPLGQCFAPPSGLVSWWPGDGNANDIIGKNPGMLQGGTTFAPGKIGQAFSFGGVDDSVMVANAPALNITTAVTIDAWIKPVSLSCHYGFCAVLAKSDFFANKRNYGLWVRSDGGLHLSYITNGGANIALNTPAGLISPGVFSHVAGVINPAGKVMQIYVNGALVASRSTTATLIPSDMPLTIGFSDPGINFDFKGLIDEAEVYNRALTFAEIAAIFAADGAGKCKQQGIVNQPPQISCNTVTVSTDAGVCFTTLSSIGNNTTNPKVVTTNGTILANISDPKANNISVTFSPAQVPKGTNISVSVTANNGLGGIASKTCIITVIDMTPPILRVPPDVTVECTSPTGQAVDIGRATANDACDPNPIVTNDAPALFGLGRTTVNWMATDASGNMATGRQSVTVRDTTAPQVTANLSPVGHVNRREGRFQVGFKATDVCDSAPEVKAVMEIPGRTEEFTVVFKGDDENEAETKDDEDKNKAEIKFDMKKKRIELEGRNEADMRALLSRMQKEGGASVSDGQVLRLHMEQEEKFEFQFENGVLKSVKGPKLSLKVTAIDRSGNKGVVIATPTFRAK